MEQALQKICGKRVTTDPFECAPYAKDVAYIPGILVHLLKARTESRGSAHLGRRNLEFDQVGKARQNTGDRPGRRLYRLFQFCSDAKWFSD